MGTMDFSLKQMKKLLLPFLTISDIHTFYLQSIKDKKNFKTQYDSLLVKLNLQENGT